MSAAHKKINDSEMNSLPCKTIVVLGMQRSGTSMTAGILKRLGVNMGKRLVGKKISNPLGHFEDRDFVRLNDQILKTAGGDSFNPPEHSAIVQQKETFAAAIEALMARKSRGVWGWKDPRTSLTMDLFLPFLINPYFIVCFRDSESVAGSLGSRDGMSPEMGKQLKECYDQRIERFFSENPHLKRLNIQYRDMIAYSRKSVDDIIDFLQLHPGRRRIKQAIELILPKPILSRLSRRLVFHDKAISFLASLERKYIRRRKR